MLCRIAVKVMRADYSIATQDVFTITSFLISTLLIRSIKLSIGLMSNCSRKYAIVGRCTAEASRSWRVMSDYKCNLIVIDIASFYMTT